MARRPVRRRWQGLFARQAGPPALPDVQRWRFGGTEPFLQYAAQNIIPSTVELGGKSPNIFFADVRMTRAADGVVHVVNRLTFAVDDTHLPLTADLTDY